MGLNNYLKGLSSNLYIKPKSPERYKVDRSLSFIIKKLKEDFGDQLLSVDIFGSYKRGTMLPRQFDEFSDVDIMVLFNTGDYNELQPESYRNQLRRFADRYYKGSLVKKDFPSIVIEMGHIKIDLVPATIDNHWFSGKERIHIPDSGGNWLQTNPNDFNADVIYANKKFNSIVKPIIRLLKRWNASTRKPFSSYNLEYQISNMNFRGDNIEAGLIYAIDQLSESQLNISGAKKLDTLKHNAYRLESFVDIADEINAKRLIKNMLKM